MLLTLIYTNKYKRKLNVNQNEVTWRANNLWVTLGTLLLLIPGWLISAKMLSLQRDFSDFPIQRGQPALSVIEKNSSFFLGHLL